MGWDISSAPFIRFSSIVSVHVTSVTHPGSFYVVMPWGPLDASAAEAEQQQPEENHVPAMDRREETLSSLMQAMQDFYRSARHRHRKLEVFASELVAAYLDGRWFRARVVNTGGYDSGCSEEVCVQFFLQDSFNPPTEVFIKTSIFFFFSPRPGWRE